MSADAKTLFDAWESSMNLLRVREMHLIPQHEQDAWKAVEEAADEHHDGCHCAECDPYHFSAYETMDAEHDALVSRVEALHRNIGRLLECVGPKTTKQALLGTIEAIRFELAVCVPE